MSYVTTIGLSQVFVVRFRSRFVQMEAKITTRTVALLQNEHALSVLEMAVSYMFFVSPHKFERIIFESLDGAVDTIWKSALEHPLLFFVDTRMDRKISSLYRNE